MGRVRRARQRGGWSVDSTDVEEDSGDGRRVGRKLVGRKTKGAARVCTWRQGASHGSAGRQVQPYHWVLDVRPPPAHPAVVVLQIKKGPTSASRITSPRRIVRWVGGPAGVLRGGRATGGWSRPAGPASLPCRPRPSRKPCAIPRQQVFRQHVCVGALRIKPDRGRGWRCGSCAGGARFAGLEKSPLVAGQQLGALVTANKGTVSATKRGSSTRQWHCPSIEGGGSTR